jgi:hypothetical protein
MQTSTLLIRIRAFIARHKASERGFGSAVINDPHLVKGLRNGRKLRPRTVQDILAYMAAVDDGKPPPPRIQIRKLPPRREARA